MTYTVALSSAALPAVIAPVLQFICCSFFRSASEKTNNEKKIKYRSAACPELVEGKAKTPTA
jgi:hypothetical protein